MHSALERLHGGLVFVRGLCVDVESVAARLCAVIDSTARLLATRRPTVADNTLLRIQELMDGAEWTSDTLGDIAELMIRAGYRVRDLNDR
jgi:hypothetical protein